MIKNALFLLVSLLACGSPSDAPQDLTSCLISPRILSGTPCDDIRSLVTKITLSHGATCSGVLTSPRTVLTAAHCLINNPPTSVTSGDISFAIEGYTINPNFRDDRQLHAFFNDTAIISVKSNSIGFLTPVTPISGETIRIFGYGLSSDGSSGKLRAAQMKIYEVTNDHLVSYYDTMSGDACFGDSGGPAIVTRNNIDYLVGIVSSGSSSDCRPGEKVLFARIGES